MLNKILAIIRKDLIVRFSTASELLFFLVLPVVFTMLLGGFAPGSGSSTVSLPVVQQDDGPLAQRLLQELQNAPTLDPVATTLPEAQRRFDDDEIIAYLVIPPDFSPQLSAGENVNLVWHAASGDTTALALRQTVLAAADRVSRAAQAAQTAVAAAENVQPFPDEASRQAYLRASLQEATTLLDEAPARLQVSQALVEEDEYDPAAQASAGQLITWVFIPLLGTSALFAYERQQGTLRRMLTTPTPRHTFLLGAISSQLVAAFVQMLLLIAFGIFVLRLPWGNAPGALLLLLLTFALAAIALGAMLGTFITSEGQANGLSIMLGMVMSLLGGAWYPLELFPPAVQSAVQVLPTTWAMRGFLDLIVRNGSLPDIVPESTVLLAFAAIFFVVAVRRFRYE